MSKQIAVRLPDEVVDFIDHEVADGRATSRAVVVARALLHEQRRAIAERDAAILAKQGPDPDLDALAAYGATVSMEHLD